MAVIRLHCFSQNLSHRLSKQASNGNDGSRVPPSPFEDYYCTGRCLLFWARSIYPTAARRERQAILRALGGIGSRDHHNHSMFGGHAVRAGRRSHYRNSKIARESSYLAACLERSLDVRRQRISNLLSGIPDSHRAGKGCAARRISPISAVAAANPTNVQVKNAFTVAAGRKIWAKQKGEDVRQTVSKEPPSCIGFGQIVLPKPMRQVRRFPVQFFVPA